MKFLNNKESSIPTLKHQGRDIQSNAEKAEVLNSFFYDCFNSALPPLGRHVSRLDPAHFPENLLISEDVVADLIDNLEISKASGPDGISSKMLKATANTIVPSLTQLFNTSIMSGNLPTDWTLARVVPVPKSKNLNSPASYRPISILSIISKIMERCVYRIIYDHLRNFYPISARQWGFLPGRSTTSALLSVTHDWLQYLERGNKVCSVYLDIRKAFDSVPHSLLNQKLS